MNSEDIMLLIMIFHKKVKTTFPMNFTQVLSCHKTILVRKGEVTITNGQNL